MPHNIFEPLKMWRRGWDLNPRSPYEDTRFRGEPIRPLWHLSDGSDHRGCVNREQVRKTEASRLETELTLGGSVLQSLDRCCFELSGDGTACRLIDPDHPPDTAPSTIQFLPLETGWVEAIAADGSGRSGHSVPKPH